MVLINCGPLKEEPDSDQREQHRVGAQRRCAKFESSCFRFRLRHGYVLFARVRTFVCFPWMIALTAQTKLNHETKRTASSVSPLRCAARMTRRARHHCLGGCFTAREFARHPSLV